jgi:hypothetical protein
MKYRYIMSVFDTTQPYQHALDVMQESKWRIHSCSWDHGDKAHIWRVLFEQVIPDSAGAPRLITNAVGVLQCEGCGKQFVTEQADHKCYAR